MALPTATITGVLYEPDGTPFASEVVQIRATPRTIVGASGGGGRVPELVIAHTDATGAIGTMAGEVFTAGVELSAGQYYIIVGDTYIKAPATVTADMVTAGAATVQNILATAEPIPPAQSVPAGGTTGQVLTKASGDDYATEWTTVDGVGGGGSGTVTSVDTGTGLTGGPITAAGTVALDAASIASLANADTAFSWGNHATSGYSTFSGAYADLTGKPSLFDGAYASLTGIPATFTPAAHTHTLADVTDSGTAAALNVPAAGDAAIGEVVKGDDSRLSDARAPTAHNHTIADVTGLQADLDSKSTFSGAYADLTGKPTLGTAAATSSADYATAAQGALADTAVQPAAIADFETTTELNARDTANRARANHTGTQLAATISDFSTAADARIAASDKVSSDPTGITGADAITNIVSLTQAEYDAIVTPDAATLYVIT